MKSKGRSFPLNYQSPLDIWSFFENSVQIFQIYLWNYVCFSILILKLQNQMHAMYLCNCESIWMEIDVLVTLAIWFQFCCGKSWNWFPIISFPESAFIIWLRITICVVVGWPLLQLIQSETLPDCQWKV